MSIRIGIGLDNFASAGIDADAQTIYNRIIADGGVSNLTRLNFFVKGLKGIYGSLANVPVCYDAHWIGYKLGSGTGATAGQAAAKLYSLTVAGDAVQSTAASQPLLLAHNGASTDNYWWGSGVAGNYVSTPNASANQITGDIEISAYVDNTGGDALFNVIGGKRTSSGYLFAISSRQVQLYITSTINSTVNVASNYIGWVKVFRSAATGVVTFYTSTDGITYTQLGLDRSTTPGNLVDNATPLLVGSWSGGSQFAGKIYRFKIATSLNGAPVVDFNPSTYNASTSQTQWTSSTGEVWTINTGTAATGYKGVLVDRTLVQGDGVDDAMETVNSVWGGISSVYSAIAYINLNTKGGTSVDSDLANFAIQKYEGIDTFNLYSVFQGGLNINKDITSRKNLNTLYNSVRNGASSAVNFNNGTSTTGTLNTAITTGVRILSSRTSAAFTNGNLNTILISGSADSGATRTATYNLIRSLNNNAF